MMEKSPAYTQKVYDIMRYEQRTHMEAKLLYDHIQDFPFFESFNERNPRNHLETEAFIQLCEKVRYEKHPPRKVLYREGDAPNGKMYLIYSGSVYTATKNPLSYMPENMSCIDINSESIDDLPEEKSAEQSSKRESDDFTAQHQSFTKPSLFWTRSAKNLFKKNNNENVNSPKETVVVTQENSFNADTEKKKRKSRTSIYVHNSVHALEQGENADKRDESDPSLTKLGQKLTEVQNEIKAQSQGKSPNGAGFANFMKLSHWANKESPENTERRRRSSTFVDPEKLATLQQINRMRRFGAGGEGFSPVGSEQGDSSSRQSNNCPTLKQLITDNGWVKSKITRGGFFGEKALFSKRPRPATIITATECEFLVFSKTLFQAVIEKYDLKRKELIEFMHSFVPAIENIAQEEQVEDLIYAFEEKIYERDAFISREGEPGTKLYLMCEGTCELTKKMTIQEKDKAKEPLDPVQKLIRVQPAKIQEIPVCTVNRGQFMGEEIVYQNRGVYDLSVRAYSAQVKVLVIDKYRFFAKFPDVSREKLGKVFQSKRRNHIEMIINYISNKYPSFYIVGGHQQENLDLLARGNIKLVPKLQTRLSMNTGLELTKSPSSSRGLLLNLSSPNRGSGIFLNVLRSEHSGTFDEYSPYDQGSTSIMKTEGSPKHFFPDKIDDEIVYEAEAQKLKRKMGAFSRTTVNLKHRAAQEENHLSNSNNNNSLNSRPNKKYTILLNNSAANPNEIQTPLLTPGKPKNDPEGNSLFLTTTQSQSKSQTQLLPKIITSPREPNPSNFKQASVRNEEKVVGEDSSQGVEEERQDSLGLTLQALVRDKGIRQYLVKHNLKHQPKTQSEAVNGNVNKEDSKYSFNRKLESMLDKAKKKKNKRMNRVTSLMRFADNSGLKANTVIGNDQPDSGAIFHQNKYQLPNIKVITKPNFFTQHPKSSRSLYMSQRRRETVDSHESTLEDGPRLEGEIFYIQPDQQNAATSVGTPQYQTKGANYHHHTLKKSSVYMKIFSQNQSSNLKKSKKENNSDYFSQN